MQSTFCRLSLALLFFAASSCGTEEKSVETFVTVADEELIGNVGIAWMTATDVCSTNHSPVRLGVDTLLVVEAFEDVSRYWAQFTPRWYGGQEGAMIIGVYETDELYDRILTSNFEYEERSEVDIHLKYHYTYIDVVISVAEE